ncbi:MAG: restriction endonuclease [Alphaproteobacteria bacterium]|nr:restriction endonuclease [Alphaproteobacteria bacterium]
MTADDIRLNGLERLVAKGFEVEFRSHAKAILNIDYAETLAELEAVLLDLSIPIQSLVKGGGGEHETTQGLRRRLTELGWRKHCFQIQKLIDGVERESISHEVDHVRTFSGGKVAMEIEWNNKDPFYDRDLENFKRLHAEAAISVGIILTRGTTLQDNIKDAVLRFARDQNVTSYDDLSTLVDPTSRQKTEVARRMKRTGDFAEAWAAAFVADKFGQATTHWRKLEDRIRRGVGNPCPLLLIGIPYSVITF